MQAYEALAKITELGFGIKMNLVLQEVINCCGAHDVEIRFKQQEQYDTVVMILVGENAAVTLMRTKSDAPVLVGAIPNISDGKHERIGTPSKQDDARQLLEILLAQLRH